MTHLVPFEGTIWRIMFADQAANPCAPVRGPQGRFHHSGQPALYSSLTAEGAGVALKRYLAPDDPARVIAALTVKFTAISDMRGNAAAAIQWHHIAASGLAAPTWAISDTARNDGAQALLYSSRTRPELNHLVIFDPARAAAAGQLCWDGNSQCWPFPT